MTAIAQIDTRRVEYMVKFYNKLACVSAESLRDIPKESAQYLLSIPHEVLVTPFILELMDRGWGRPNLSKRFGLTEDVIRGIGRKYRGWK